MSASPEMLLEQICETPEAAERLLIDAIASARRLAESGNFAQVRMLAGLLFIRAQMLEDQATVFLGASGQAVREKALEVLAEALALLDRSADEGDEIAEICLFTASNLVSADAFRLASSMAPE